MAPAKGDAHLGRKCGAGLSGQTPRWPVAAKGDQLSAKANLLASERQTIAGGRAKLVAVQSDLKPALRVGVVLLAAGASSRMGQPKLLLPWRATTVLGHLIEQWQKLSAQQIAVVCAAGDQAIEQELN